MCSHHETDNAVFLTPQAASQNPPLPLQPVYSTKDKCTLELGEEVRAIQARGWSHTTTHVFPPAEGAVSPFSRSALGITQPSFSSGKVSQGYHLPSPYLLLGLNTRGILWSRSFLLLSSIPSSSLGPLSFQVALDIFSPFFFSLLFGSFLTGRSRCGTVSSSFPPWVSLFSPPLPLEAGSCYGGGFFLPVNSSGLSSRAGRWVPLQITVSIGHLVLFFFAPYGVFLAEAVFLSVVSPFSLPPTSGLRWLGPFSSSPTAGPPPPPPS